MCGCDPQPSAREVKDKKLVCVGFRPCGCAVWRKRRARYVGAKSRQNTVFHAVWVTHDTEPYEFYGAGEDNLRVRLESGQIREGISVCGVFLPAIIAGAQGGHDWPRIPSSEQCTNCQIRAGEYL